MPFRAVLGDRKPGDAQTRSWPRPAEGDPLKPFLDQQDMAPWSASAPLLLPEGRFCRSGKSIWWKSRDGLHALPVRNSLAAHVAGMELTSATGLWDGRQLSLFSARTDWGRIQLND